jgi:putative flavoprotein involved in K+ transport
MASESIHTVIIGAGQAGLATGYHLQQRGVPFVILEANAQVGDAWRNRWDSLRLFTPAIFDSIDGMPFPADPFYFPTKDEMADYLEAYVGRFNLPVRTNAKVKRLARSGDRFCIDLGEHQILADNVIVAMAAYQKPKLPDFAAELNPAIVQLHSSAYRNPGQLKQGNVLLVGAGNSGAEIAMDLCSQHKVLVAGRAVGQIPFNIQGRAARLFLARLFLRVFFHRIATLNSPIGRKMKPHFLSRGGPLIRTREADLKAANVERVGRVTEVRAGKPVVDGKVLDIANVIWCTGFHPGFSWIEFPVFDDRGWPIQERGVVSKEAGLYFVGLAFLYSPSSTMIHGVSRDAAFIANDIARRRQSPWPRAAVNQVGKRERIVA